MKHRLNVNYVHPEEHKVDKASEKVRTFFHFLISSNLKILDIKTFLITWLHKIPVNLSKLADFLIRPIKI